MHLHVIRVPDEDIIKNSRGRGKMHYSVVPLRASTPHWHESLTTLARDFRNGRDRNEIAIALGEAIREEEERGLLDTGFCY